MKQFSFSNFASFIVLTLSANAFAFPKINDTATWTIKETANGNTLESEETSTLTFIDQEKDIAKVLQTVVQNGQIIVNETETLDIASLMGEYMVLDQCKDLAQEGALPVRITILGIKMNACYIKSEAPIDDEGNFAIIEMWYGKVPFGVLKSTITTSDYKKEVSLKSYTEN